VNVSSLPGRDQLSNIFALYVGAFSSDASTSIPSVPSFVFNAITRSIHFFTGSTTNTKNTYKCYFLADLGDANKPVEVCHEIQR